MRFSKAVFQTFRAALVYVLSYVLVAAVLDRFHPDACLLQVFGGLLAVWLVLRREKKKGFDWLKEKEFAHFDRSAKELTSCGLLGFSLNCLVGGFINLLPLSGTAIQNYSDMVSEAVEGANPILAFAVLSLVAPVLEEVYFRGFLLGKLKREIKPETALILVSLAFGLLHGQSIWILYATVLGLILGMVCLLYDSVYPSMAVHASFNLVSGIPMLMDKDSSVYRITYGNRLFLILMLIAGLAGTAALVYRMYFRKFMEAGGECGKRKITGILRDKG